jgi:hypothetical protein
VPRPTGGARRGLALAARSVAAAREAFRPALGAVVAARAAAVAMSDAAAADVRSMRGG